MRSKFAKLIDSVALFGTVFVLIFAWVRFYSHNAIWSAIAGAVVGVIVCIFLNHFADKRERKKVGSNTQKRSAETLGINLLGATSDEVQEYFFQMLKKESETIKKLQNCLKIRYYSAQNEMHSTVHSTQKTALVFPFFHKIELDVDDLILILKLARALGENVIQIYSIKATENAQNFARKIKNFQIIFYDQYDLFNRRNPATPSPVSLNTEPNKLGFNDYLKFAFSPPRAKNYLLFGLIILATSFIVPYKIYYLIFGSLLCLTALAVRLVKIK